MPQVQLPLFPAGSQNINPDVAFVHRDNQITYFNGQMPLFTHAADDLSSFRLFTTQLIVNGSATQDEIVKAFGVSVTTVKRCVKRCRQGGSKALFVPPRRRAGTKLDAEHLAQAQHLLDQGLAVPAISQQRGILASTLHKAIRCGRLQMGKKKPRVRPRLPGQHAGATRRSRPNSADGSGHGPDGGAGAGLDGATVGGGAEI